MNSFHLKQLTSLGSEVTRVPMIPSRQIPSNCGRIGGI